MSREEIEALRDKTDVVMSIDAEYQKAIKDELDDIFKDDISSKVFKYCQPLDMVFVPNESGAETSEMFIMLFIKAFGEELKKYQQKVSPAMEKHLAKYKK